MILSPKTEVIIRQCIDELVHELSIRWQLIHRLNTWRSDSVDKVTTLQGEAMRMQRTLHELQALVSWLERQNV